VQVNDQRDPRTYAIIGAAMDVHPELGRGFLERVYQDALEVEFMDRAVPHLREIELGLQYKGRMLNAKYRADFLCYDEVVVETKAQESLTCADDAQAINYLKSTSKRVALLLNLGTDSLQFKRLVL